MSNVKTKNLQTIYDQGIREGIRFASEYFLGNLPPEIYESEYQKTSEYIINQYNSLDKKIEITE